MPFVLVQVEDSSVSEVHVIGNNSIPHVIVDWDTIEGDESLAQELMDQITDNYKVGDTPEPAVRTVLNRLQGIIDEVEDEDDLLDDLDDDDDDLIDDMDDEDDDDLIDDPNLDEPDDSEGMDL